MSNVKTEYEKADGFQEWFQSYLGLDDKIAAYQGIYVYPGGHGVTILKENIKDYFLDAYCAGYYNAEQKRLKKRS